jgi:hypothetical protein
MPRRRNQTRYYLVPFVVVPNDGGVSIDDAVRKEETLMRLWRWLKYKQRSDPGPLSPVCPSCLSRQTAVVIPASPEVIRYQCQYCNHQWEVPLPTPAPPLSD